MTTGTAPGIFEPHAVSDRAQVVTLLWRLAGEPAPGWFEPAPCNRTFTAIGDSVMGPNDRGANLGGADFAGWDATVDAHGCRMPHDDLPGPSICGPDVVRSALHLLQEANRNATLGEVVIVHTGTNGVFHDDTFDLMMAALEPARTVFFVTIRTPWWNGVGSNAAIRDGVARWDDVRDVRLLDWQAITDGAAELLDADGFHLSPAGRTAYREMIAGALSEA